jgi:nucleoside 2-deoxyribosyltransferase
VDRYSFASDQEQEMMKQAMKDIDDSDFLIAEASHKAIGLGVEVGYAKAKNKPIVYLRKRNAEHSTTVSSISDFHVIYDTISDLETKLSQVIIGLPNRNR